jgi:hypothetical protein
MTRRFISAALIVTAGYACGQTGNSKGRLSPDEQAAAIEAVREYALNYTKGLPNYTCTQTTQQTSRTPNAVNNPVIETTVIEEQLSFIDRQEVRTVTRIDGHSVAPDADKRQTRSQGEFAYLLNSIFEPATGSGFRWDRQDKINLDKINNRRVNVIAFHVPQSRGYLLKGSKGNLHVPFEGFVYADAQTNAVLRIQLKCTMIPAHSEIQALDLTLDYKAAQVAGQEFILPSHFVLHFLNTVEDRQHIHDAVYSAYRRFSADAAIQFEGDKQ